VSRFSCEQLGQLCRPKQWKTLTKANLLADGFPVYGANGQIGFTDSYTHEQPTLLIGCRGSCGTVHITAPRSYANGNAMALDGLDSSRVDINFLAHYFRYRGVSDVISGTSQPQIIQQNLVRVEVPLPSLPEQRRIAAILDQAGALRAKRWEALAQLDSLTHSIFIEMFGNPIINEKKWPLERLDKLARIERGKFSPRPRNDPSYYGGCFPFIQIGDISNCDGRLNNWSQTLNERGKAVSRSFPPGTVVIAIVGATLGITAILDVEVYCPDSIIGLIPDKQKSSAEYIDWILRFWRPTFVSQAPETARANMNLESLRPLKIPLPPFSLQREFSHKVAAVNMLKSKQVDSLSKLDSLFASLQHRAFRGEL